MLEPLKRVVLRSPLAGPARWLHRRLWPPTIQELDGRYNDETEAVMTRVLTPDAICLDIGAHRGNVLTAMVQLAPRAQHCAFEPLPGCAAYLRAHFPGVQVHEVALSDEPGSVMFHHAVSNPGYSGLRRRNYPGGSSEVVETITVQAARLDDLVPPGTPVRFVKVDVEGGELGVFRGGQRVFRESRPVVVFEHGLGAADRYGTRPEQVCDLLSSFGLTVTTMSRWLGGRSDLTRGQFVRQFATSENFYFMAYGTDGNKQSPLTQSLTRS